MKKASFPAIISTSILCFGFWLLITASLEPQEIIAGAVVSIAVAVFSAGFLIHGKAFYLFNPIRFLALLFYCLIIFMWELIKANLSVAFCALKPGKLNINPGIVKVPVDLKSDYGLAMLANSITLTPGTITMDVTEQNDKTFFYIHWLNVTERDSVKAGDAIKGTLEKWTGRVWQ